MNTHHYDWERFDSHIKDTIRARLDCRAVVADAGLVRKRTSGGRYVTIHCPDPAHDDARPSCSVGRDGFKCHACGASGDVFTLVGFLHDLDSFEHKLRSSAELAGIDYDAERDRFMRQERESTWNPTTHEDLELHASRDLSEYAPEQVVDNFDDLISPDPLNAPLGPREPVRTQVWHALISELTLEGAGAEYLAARGISPQLARALGVRYADHNTWREVLRRAWRAFGPRALDAAGVLGRGTTNLQTPHPSCYGGALVFAYSGGSSHEALRFRNLDPDASIRYLSLRGAHNQPRLPYLCDLTHRPLIGSSPRRTLYVTEGEINALSLAALGRAAIGLPGADSWRTQWAQGFADFNRVILLLDGDRASETLHTNVLASSTQLYGAEWTQQRVHGHVLTGHDGEVVDANDALVSGDLESALRALEFHTTDPTPSS